MNRKITGLTIFKQYKDIIFSSYLFFTSRIGFTSKPLGGNPAGPLNKAAGKKGPRDCETFHVQVFLCRFIK